MKVYVQTDLEGVAGVTFFENLHDASFENAQHRQRMRRLLTGEVNAAVLGALDAGATEVVVNDSHASGYNIIFEDLDPRCEIVHGRNTSGPHWLPEFDASFAALVLVGMHAMGATPNAVLPHSKWEVNGGEIFLSEASMAAALAGCRNVPAVFVSGDDKIVSEMREKIPAIRHAQVKKGLGAYQARSLIPSRARALIAERVREAVACAREIPPYVIPGPLRLNLLDAPGFVPPLKPALPKPIEAANMEEAFMAFLRQARWCKLDTAVPDGFQYP